MPCAARVGGNWNNGSNAGPVYWNCNNAPSNSNVNYRARHSYSNTYEFLCTPYSLRTSDEEISVCAENPCED